MFKALLLTKTPEGTTQAAITALDEAELPEGEVLVNVAYSTVNYKDALAITGQSPVVRKFPMVPGIDFAGTVAQSSDARFKPGDAVLLNGWGVGETHWGGLSHKARVKADWLVPIPDGLDARQTMAIGTAGYTAMLCVMALMAAWVVPSGVLVSSRALNMNDLLGKRYLTARASYSALIASAPNPISVSSARVSWPSEGAPAGLASPSSR